MKIRVVSSKQEIDELNANERLVHLAFRASNTDFLTLMKKCPRLRAVQIPPSYKKTMSNAITMFMDMQGIDLLEGDVWGHRKDIDEYFTVDETTLNEIKSGVASGKNIEDMAEEIQKKTKLASDLIKYIAGIKATA
jgi:hypothetical protein